MTISKFSGKAIMVTGACGTVGRELVNQLISRNPSKIVCIDNNETELFFLQQDMAEHPEIEFHLVDIRNLDELSRRMEGIEIVLHAAALKHVGLCEDAPNEAIQTNIQGCQNVISAAQANNVDRVIFTSSDKAVNPTNVMGTTKLMGERLFTAAAIGDKGRKTIFASTRFGNVLGSRGSVIPLFHRQIKKGGPITLTNKEMTRFIMTLEQAAKLVLDSVWKAVGGEVFVTRMPVARIEDLAIVMKERLADGDKHLDIVEIGAKPGEKLYEELMNDEEVRRSYQIDGFLVVVPAFVSDHLQCYPYLVGQKKADNPYNSHNQTALTKAELSQYLSDDILSGS